VALELADIFRQYGADYRQKYADRLLPSQRQAMLAIERCRTEALGGQVFACPSCGETGYSYHSCRNRHCPKCQQERTQAWLTLQRELLLPVPYFMLTFTLPEALRNLTRQNQKLFYQVLFQASAEATQQLAKDPRFVGGQIGMIGVLHTWTRNLLFHPHVHYLVPGGGWKGMQWLPSRTDFFLPVKALSKLFRARFQALLQKSPLFSQIPNPVWFQDWVVHCLPVGDGQAAFKYLAPYIYRVALSNRRLIEFVDKGCMEKSQVTFQYRTSDTAQLKRCTLSVEQFIPRFLQHVLPKGFVKVRYFGFLAHNRRTTLAALQKLLGKQAGPEATTPQPEPDPAAPLSPKFLCPACGAPMDFLRSLAPCAAPRPVARSP
jgi:Putative transposase/Transposase zinc-binding domain